MATATLSAGVITDAIRIAGIQGDGITAPDSSVGIWPATTNDLPNNDFSTGVTGWTAASCTRAITTEFGNPGAASGQAMKMIATSTATCGVFNDLTVAAGAGIRACSVWVGVPVGSSAIGKFAQFLMQEHGGAAANAQFAIYSHPTAGVSGFPLVAGWNRLTTIGTVVQSDRTFLRFQVNLASPATNDALYIAWPQIERAGVVTPYAITTRSDGRVELPALELAPKKGWIALRVAPSRAAIDPPASPPVLARWGTPTNGIELALADGAVDVHRITGGSVETARASTLFVAGAEVDVVATWNAETVLVSINGNPGQTGETQLFMDDFARADTTTAQGLGTAPTGQVWTNQGSGNCRIVSGRAIADADQTKLYNRMDLASPATRVTASVSWLGTVGPQNGVAFLSTADPTQNGAGNAFISMVHIVVSAGAWTIETYSGGLPTTVRSGVWPNIPGVTIFDVAFNGYQLLMDGTIYDIAIDFDLASGGVRLVVMAGATEVVDRAAYSPLIAAKHGKHTIWQIFRLNYPTPNNVEPRFESVAAWAPTTAVDDPGAIPAIGATTMEIGSAGDGSGHLSGQVLWAAAGRGELSDHDLATLAALAGDPTRGSFPGDARLRTLWMATDAECATYRPRSYLGNGGLVPNWS